MKRIVAFVILGLTLTGCATMRTAWRRADSLNPHGGIVAQTIYRGTIGH